MNAYLALWGVRLLWWKHSPWGRKRYLRTIAIVRFQTGCDQEAAEEVAADLYDPHRHLRGQIHDRLEAIFNRA